ncbi:MAG: AAA family ATPase [Prevotellaceae bacterium]|jgi:predicted ATPase|nr:AAA family ATPase [Prevotellaceae bacterium]
MKLSIHNFKTIRELNGFKFNSINIISGVNSSGKTSFIQFLLMLKQTLEAQSANSTLIFDGNWVELGNFEKLVYKQQTDNSIGFELQFDKTYLINKFPSILGIENVLIKVNYSLMESKMTLSNIKITYKDSKREHFVEFTKQDDIYNCFSDSALLVSAYSSIQAQGTISTISFLPQILFAEIDNPQYPEIDKNPKTTAAIAIKIKEIQSIIIETFNSISYIGPLREEPKDLYDSNSKNKSIGKKGEYAAQFFEDEASNEIEFYDVQSKELQKMSLSNAVKYWICDIFNLAKDIKAEKYKDSYIVKVVNHYDVESTIKQVGFGISQVLPIVVEGLRMPRNGILILEQPEIHLHPKVQSMLFDFVYSLSLTGKKFVIETHSDHFITRMRRRIAEDDNKLAEKINLVFVEQREAEHLFRKMELDDMGTFDFFPTDFVEQTEDLDAIIIAQAKKARYKNK